jgi:hypothetical protein
MLRKLILVALVATASGSSAAQWYEYPSPGAPRTANGQVDLAGPTPRLANGKPDLSGVWMSAESTCGRVMGPTSVPRLLELVPSSLKCPAKLPWLAELVQERTANQAKDDPHIRCLPDLFLRAYGLPHYLKFVQTPGLLVMLNEMNGVYRQVFSDGRPLPKDPNPSWQGYSSASWSGDTLVIDTIGFRDDLWIDWDGSVITEAAKLREQIRRPDFGHLEIEVTVDDPKAYTKPWTVTLRQQFAGDAELVDEICAENEKDSQRLK